MKTALLSLFVLLTAPSFAQTMEEVRNKHLPLIQAAKTDSLLVDRLIDFSTDLAELNDDTALVVLDHAMQISRKAGFTKGIGMVYCGIAGILHNKGLLDSSLSVYYRGLAFLEPDNYRFQGVAWTGIAHDHLQMGRMDSAVQAYFRGLEAWQLLGDTRRMSHSYNGLSLAFSQMDQLEKSLHYLLMADSIFVATRDTTDHVKMLINIGDKYDRLKRFNEAADVFRESFRISDVARYQFGRFYGRVALGELYGKCEHLYDSSIYYLRQAETISKGFQVMPVYLNVLYQAFSQAYFATKQYGLAREYLLRAQPVMVQSGHLPTLMGHYLMLTKVNAKLGLNDASLQSLDLYVQYRDSLQKTEVSARLNELDVKYHTLEKDKSLADQQLSITKKDLELRKKSQLLIALGGGLLLVVAVAGGLYIHFRQKHQLQLQQMQLMQKESELAMAQATMEGEEKERARIARNLHDGAGSILSGVKLYLSSLETQYQELSGSTSYRNTLGLLNEAVTEIRDTSHNLMPRLLFEEGIEAAAAAYCEKLGRNKSLEIEYQSYGEPRRFSPHFELMIYRMLQELLNNVMKHAAASHVLVQLNFNEDAFSMIVEDNGKGMEVGKDGAGIGMYSLRSRASAFRGSMEVDSSDGGTSVSFEFPVNGSA